MTQLHLFSQLQTKYTNFCSSCRCRYKFQANFLVKQSVRFHIVCQQTGTYLSISFFSRTWRLFLSTFHSHCLLLSWIEIFSGGQTINNLIQGLVETLSCSTHDTKKNNLSLPSFVLHKYKNDEPNEPMWTITSCLSHLYDLTVVLFSNMLTAYTSRKHC